MLVEKAVEKELSRAEGNGKLSEPPCAACPGRPQIAGKGKLAALRPEN